MSDLLNPKTLLEQHRILEQRVTETKDAARIAQEAAANAKQAAEAAQAAWDHQEICMHILQEAYYLVQRLHDAKTNHFDLPKMKLRLSSSVTGNAYVWPLDKAGKYMLALPTKHRVYVAKVAHDGKLKVISSKELLGFDDALLSEMLESMRNIGKPQPDVKTGGDQPQSQAGQSKQTTEKPRHANPNIYESDRSAHVAMRQPDDSADG
jgi:hypothetical protein